MRSPRGHFVIPLPSGRALELGDRCLVMGILNVTPDSFGDRSHFPDAQTAIDRALQMQDEGADIIDIGGESTRPGADPVGLEEELRRVLPVLDGLVRRAPNPAVG